MSPGILNVGAGDVGSLRVVTAARPWPDDVQEGRAPATDLSGRIFWRLRVLCYLGFSRSSWSSYWLCACACGRIVAVRGKSLRRSHAGTQSCGCLAAELASSRSWRGHGDLSRHYWNHLKHHAAERGVPFAITIEEAWTQFEAQGGRCALSGVALTMGRYRPRERSFGVHPRLGTASLDRKDSGLGYTPSNVQWVLKEINRMKGRLSDEAFVFLCKAVAAHNGSA